MVRSIDWAANITNIIDRANSSRSNNSNEAETRHKIIDCLLHEVLNWPKNRVAVEEYIKPGFADYVLKKADGSDILFIEAKRSGYYFELPLSHDENETFCFQSISKLHTDKNVKEAMTQVRNYCMDTGCEYAAITNGHEWIFFKTFEKNKRWDSLQAFVIRKIEYFRDDYTNASKLLSYIAITDRSSLPQLLTSMPPKDREIFFPKDRISFYSHSINANRLASFLRPIVSNLFGVIGDGQTEFMDRCYVSERDYSQAANGMKSLIQDSLTPYFEDYGIKQLEETGKGGGIGGKITKNIKNERGGEVLVLFGGKGAGKSTFVKRLLHHSQPPWLKDHSVIAIVDLLKVPEEQEAVKNAIWQGLVTNLDRDNILLSDRENILRELFSDRYQVAKRQELSGLNVTSDAYNTKLNSLVASWKLDFEYCVRKLSEYWAARGKGVVVVVDNTDQFSGDLQDFCFSTAQQVSEQLKCITLISMREERFHNSKIHGLLDAFQNSGFHISSPKPSKVFLRRLEYAVSLLQDPRKRHVLTNSNDEKLIADCCEYMQILSAAFKHQGSPLNQFLTACGHGDIRLSLDLFRSFLLSGYTNVEEMLKAGQWTFLIHQVIKPVMIPTRYFYDEKLSDIPNIFQLRDKRHSSHFTALRILRILLKGSDAGTPSFHDVAELKATFAEKFQMVGDLESNLDVLLQHGFIESNNRVDYYDLSVDRLRITSYGRYVYEKLAFSFTYLDLVSIDCGVFNEEVSNYIVEAAKDEYKLFTSNKRIDRVNIRLKRVEAFIRYLNDEECRENDEFSLNLESNLTFTVKAKSDFAAEKVRIKASAAKQALKRAGR